MIKITYTVFPRVDLDYRTAMRLWMEDHGALVVRHAESLRLVRYVQTPRGVFAAVEAAMARSRSIDPPHPLGLAELYWNSREELDFSFTDPVARNAYRELLEDEKRFAEWKLSSPWIGEERVVIGAEAR
ncbi:MAG: EthD domain-containing protein [Hyphomicrobiaceae bacterium]|nr:EthD domain-containing protein [Hyphomicrobiaceae bacterium]